MKPTAHPFRYPTEARGRVHGPAGYKDYVSYRPWLEDEFLFRCVYCLKRQKWARTDIWSVEHLVPQSEAPELACNYDNLVLACQRCNSRKLDDTLPDPAALAYGKCLQVDDASAEVRPLNDDGRLLIRALRLNDLDQVRYRRDIMRDLEIMARCAPEVWRDKMGFPEELPNLHRRIPPGGNTRPAGVEQSCHARKARGELPDVYE